MSYPPPIDELLTLGEPRLGVSWIDYWELDLTEEHIPQLIRMVTDLSFNILEGDDPRVWAPLHAWRALGQLKAKEAIEPLLSILDPILFESDDDWLYDDLPIVFRMIGPKAAPPLIKFLKDESHHLRSRSLVVEALEEIGNYHEGSRQACIDALVEQLTNYETNDVEFNGSLAAFLAEMYAIENLPLIMRAYDEGFIEEDDPYWEMVVEGFELESE